MSDAPNLLPCPFCGREAKLNDYTHAPVGAWVLTHKESGCILRIVEQFSSADRAIDAWNRRADLAPDPSVTVKTAAKHLLTIWDRWMASDDAGPDAGFLMLQSACFAAQAYEDAAPSDMTAESAPGQMLRTLLVALIDLSSPELDHLRACNQPSPKRATPEALTSLQAGEGFATSGAEGRWIEDMKAGVYDDPVVPRSQIIEATDPNFIWGALDNVHDGDTTLDDYAAAVSRAIRAALLPTPPREGVEP